ncbi:MAG TPA: aspartate aminotransferase family protein [Methylomirabilota bacterium]|jgi:glutamate-1-semialdehyde 2,1-aminomutase|nr:aspartate aminotransferase family protein [Methylomirabilota bacterium]
MASFEAARERILATYRDRTKRSRELFEQAGQALAGGTTRTSVFFAPYPSYIVEGRGARITDLDGNVLLDFVNNFTSLYHGHAYPPIVEAAARQLARGSAYAAPSELEIQLAALIQERLPSLERLRFTSSGSEAVMFALRLARAFTGRRKIAKFEGGFHGSHELAQVSVSPTLDAAGPPEAPRSVPTSAGIPAEWAEDVLILPFNDAAAVERLLDRHPGAIAALIVEPVMGSGGVIAARPDFLAALREVTARRGILLIFDEIISLRVALGGAQARYGVRPDLTTVGKIIAGGFPMAAFGGRADVMALLDPRGGAPAIPQSGTFNGAVVCCAAGLAGYGGITAEVQARTDALGEDLRARVNALFRRLSVRAQMVGVGSLANIHFSGEPLADYRAVARGDRARTALLALALLNRGVFVAPRGLVCTSSVMTSADIDAFLAALEGALTEDLEV